MSLPLAQPVKIPIKVIKKNSFAMTLVSASSVFHKEENMKKTFKVLSQKVVYEKGPIRLVDSQVQMPNGMKLSRQILEHSGAVVIIPQFGPGRYALIRQFRFAAKDWLYEFPAGGIEKGESLKKAATRELMEEIGYKPGKLTKLVDFYPTPGICAEVMHIYLAENLTSAKAQGDEDEDIEVCRVTLAEIGQMIKRRKIRDAKTMIGYFCLQNPKAFA